MSAPRTPCRDRASRSRAVAALTAVSTVLAATGPVLAGPPKVIVLQTEGRADAATRTRIDTSLREMASTTSTDVAAGDISFTDAATAVGCAPETQACRDEVLGMLAVDEVVYGTATGKAGSTELVVHRIVRGSTKSARATLGTGPASEDLAPIEPLFGISRAAPKQEPTPPPTSGEVVTADPFAPAPTAPAAPAPAPLGNSTQVDAPQRTSRLPLAGMIGGGAMVALGFLMWGEASSIQEEIDMHPTTTRDDLSALASLESRGDAYATWGNVMFLGGIVIGAVSTYYFVRNRGRARGPGRTTAQVTPALFPSGAGLTLTIGGTP